VRSYESISESFSVSPPQSSKTIMIIGFNKYLLSVLFIAIFVPVSHSKVIIFDKVTTVQTPVNIRVLTKDGFFSAGGRVVDIYLNSYLLKKILTGGDGYGYLKYIPREPGLKIITARSKTESASGRILVMTENEKAILIETEGAFKDTVFSDEIRKSCQKVVTSLSENYRIIYLYRFLGKGITESWLKKHHFPESAILQWNGPKTIDKLKKNSVQLHAIIGSADVIDTVNEQTEKRFSFEKTKDGTTVKDWEEIWELLVKSPLHDSLENVDFNYSDSIPAYFRIVPSTAIP